jgi:hypothetical protein
VQGGFPLLKRGVMPLISEWREGIMKDNKICGYCDKQIVGQAVRVGYSDMHKKCAEKYNKGIISAALYEKRRENDRRVNEA